MISGIHAIIYSKQAERLREFLRDVLKLPFVDAGHGRLIFASPPAELATHPDEDSYHELYLMCDDVQSTAKALQTKGVTLTVPIADRGWGFVTRLKLPSGDEIGLYQPKHRTATGLKIGAREKSWPTTRSKSGGVAKKRASKTKLRARK
jgi:predicted enzyme related to lactoylglutathione lyase